MKKEEEGGAGGIQPQAKECGGHQKLERARNRFSPPVSVGEQPGWHLDFSPVIKTFGLQNWEKTNLCCLSHSVCGTVAPLLSAVSVTHSPLWSKTITWKSPEINSSEFTSFQWSALLRSRIKISCRSPPSCPGCESSLCLAHPHCIGYPPASIGKTSIYRVQY